MIKANLARNLAPIINVSPERALNLLENFQIGNRAFFETYFLSLPTAEFVVNNTLNISANETLLVEHSWLAKGSFGALARNRKKAFVYKRIKMGWYSNRVSFLQSVFREFIIQTLLQNDETYGNHICKIFKVYRSDDYFIAKLELLETTLYDRLQNDLSGQQTHLVHSNSLIVQGVLVKLLTIMAHFKTVYGFSHEDLHLKNIMTSLSGPISIKLIDFGQSLVVFDGLVIIGEKREDYDWDSKNLFSYVLHDLKGLISKKLTDSIKQLENEKNLSVLISELGAFSGGKRKTKRIQRKTITRK